MSGDDLVRALAWLGLGLWVTAMGLFLRRRHRSAAVIGAVLALPYLLGASLTLFQWLHDPAAYVGRYGRAKLSELPGDVVVLALSGLSLMGCSLVYGGRRRWMILVLSLSGAGVAVFFYLAYYFRIF